MSLYYPKANSAKPSVVKVIPIDDNYFEVNAYWPEVGIWEPLDHTRTREMADATRDAWLAHSAGNFDYTNNTITGA